MTIPAGHRFEATQALRQVLARALSWGLHDVNPAKLGVENPQRHCTTCTISATATGSPRGALPGIEPRRRVYDLRHTFATFALRAGISTFDLSRYMGTSLAMIDRHHGHLARDGREHAIKLLDTYGTADLLNVHAVDARWPPNEARDGNWSATAFVDT